MSRAKKARNIDKLLKDKSKKRTAGEGLKMERADKPTEVLGGGQGGITGTGSSRSLRLQEMKEGGKPPKHPKDKKNKKKSVEFEEEELDYIEPDSTT